MSDPNNQPPPETDAISAALATRDSIMQSLKEQHAQMFELVERQKKEALNSLQNARGLLDESRPNVPSASDYISPSQPTTSTDLHARLSKACETLTQGIGDKTNNPALQKQASKDIADAIADFVAKEVTRHLRR